MFGGGVAQRQTRKLRSKARRGIPEQLPLTIAGVALPFEDEFKHFKCIRTTGTGKSTVIRELLHAALNAILSIWMRLAIFQTMSLGEGDHRLWFAVDELDALGAINGLPDALTRLRKFGGRCVLGLQSIAQASTNYGPGVAQSLIENCGNTLILRCSASEGGGTAWYASRLIGEREVVRRVRSVSRSTGMRFGSDRDTKGHSEQTVMELAVLSAEIEQLRDRTGLLKFASQPGWMRVAFPVYETEKLAAPFVPR